MVKSVLHQQIEKKVENWFANAAPASIIKRIIKLEIDKEEMYKEHKHNLSKTGDEKFVKLIQEIRDLRTDVAKHKEESSSLRKLLDGCRRKVKKEIR